MKLDPEEQLLKKLTDKPSVWLVTGCAGFIGSHLVEKLLQLNQVVTGIDDFSTGNQMHLDEILEHLTAEQRSRFTLIRGSVLDTPLLSNALKGVKYVLHQAALASVPESFQNPAASFEVNVLGGIRLIQLASQHKIKKIVFASSCSVYGRQEHEKLSEDLATNCLSPYALGKLQLEDSARLLSLHYGIPITALRYFNVFGPRQDPTGPYSAVIPIWIRAMLTQQETLIYGDGSTSRDFVFVSDVVKANLLAALSELPNFSRFNVGTGIAKTLLQLNQEIGQICQRLNTSQPIPPCRYHKSRIGDISSSQADTHLAASQMGLKCETPFLRALEETINWYARYKGQSEKL